MDQKDFEIRNGVLVKYHGYDAKVCVPEGVKSIGAGAFTRLVERSRYRRETEDVYEGPAGLPPMLRNPEEAYIDGPTRQTTVRKIVEKVEEGLDFLLWITLPEGVKEIHKRAFYDCRKLTHVEFPESLRRISSGAFQDCNWLDEVVLPCEAKVMPHAFDDHTKIFRRAKHENADFLIQDRVLIRYLGHDECVRVPDGVRCIGKEAFTEAVMSDRGIAMRGLSCIREVVLPPGIEEIGERAFGGCENLTHIELPQSLRLIGGSAFSACRSLKQIVIPEQVTEIGKYAFMWCENLMQIELPNFIRAIGEKAFSGCSCLKKIIVPPDMKVLPNEFGEIEVVQRTKISSEDFVIRDHVLLRYLGHDECVRVPDGVRAIGENAFTEAVMSDGRITMQGLSCVREVVLPSSAEEIGERAFMGCENLTRVELPENLRLIGKEAFYVCRSLKEIKIPEQVTEIAEHAFGICESLEKIDFPEGIRVIGKNAFCWCRRLKEIVLPKKLEKIGYAAFNMCEQLEHVHMPDTLKSIEGWAFRGANLEKVTLPSDTRTEHAAFNDETKIIRVPK